MVLEVKKALFASVHYGMLAPLPKQTHCLYIYISRCVEALTRAAQSDRQLLPKAVSMFEVCTNVW